MCEMWGGGLFRAGWMDGCRVFVKVWMVVVWLVGSCDQLGSMGIFEDVLFFFLGVSSCISLLVQSVKAQQSPANGKSHVFITVVHIGRSTPQDTLCKSILCKSSLKLSRCGGTCSGWVNCAVKVVSSSLVS